MKKQPKKKKPNTGAGKLYKEFLKLEARDKVRNLHRKAKRIENKLTGAEDYGTKDYQAIIRQRLQVQTDIDRLQIKHGLRKRRTEVQQKAEKRSKKLKGQHTEHDFWDAKKLRKSIASKLNTKKRINGVSTKNPLIALSALDEILLQNSPYIVIVIDETLEDVNVSIREITEDELEERKERTLEFNAQRKAYQTRKAAYNANKNKGLENDKR